MKKFIRARIVSRLWKGALKKFSREQPVVIAVTGSVGKTSAKEAIALVLKQSGRSVLKTPGNLNTEVGVPLALLGFEESPDGFLEWLSAIILSYIPPRLQSKRKGRPYYVLEYSADKPGDIAFLVRKIPGDIGVLTRIAPAHLETYPDFTALIREKASLLTGLKEGKTAVLNADDPTQAGIAPAGITVFWYGIGAAGNRTGVWADNVQIQDGKITCTITFSVARKMDTIGGRQSQSFQVTLSVIARHQLYPLLAAAAVGYVEQVPMAKIKQAMEEYKVPAGRGRLIEGKKETRILDESYNSSPEAVKAALSSLRPLAGGHRTVAILGTMNELGSSSETAHLEVARYAVDKVDFLVVVGHYGEQMLRSAVEAGLPATQGIAFATPAQLIDKLEQIVLRGDLVLIKASQNGMRLERVVKALMEHPQQADKLLVRQSNYWKKRT